MPLQGKAVIDSEVGAGVGHQAAAGVVRDDGQTPLTHPRAYRARTPTSSASGRSTGAKCELRQLSKAELYQRATDQDVPDGAKPRGGDERPRRLQFRLQRRMFICWRPGTVRPRWSCRSGHSGCPSGG
jgi:hypothetical protein